MHCFSRFHASSSHACPAGFTGIACYVSVHLLSVLLGCSTTHLVYLSPSLSLSLSLSLSPSLSVLVHYVSFYLPSICVNLPFPCVHSIPYHIPVQSLSLLCACAYACTCTCTLHVHVHVEELSSAGVALIGVECVC